MPISSQFSFWRTHLLSSLRDLGTHHTSLLSISRGEKNFLRTFRGAHGSVNLWIWANTRVHMVADKQDFVPHPKGEIVPIISDGKCGWFLFD